MPEITSKPGICKQCASSVRFLLHVQVFANGSENFLWVCDKCNAKNPGRDTQFYIPAAKVRAHLNDEQIGNLPRILPEVYNRCVRCGNRMTELHHWAPKAIFGDEAEKWPKDFLCKDCHDQWHRMVTPQIVNPND